MFPFIRFDYECFIPLVAFLHYLTSDEIYRHNNYFFSDHLLSTR